MTKRGKVLIIAEAGVNHNGSLDLALKLVDGAHEAGADVVKFQTFIPEKGVSVYAPKAEYQKRTTGVVESQLDMVRKLQLGVSEHEAIIARCRRRGIQFMSSPFDPESIDLLVKRFGQRTLKLPSGEITNALYLLKLARANRRLIVSTGMCTLGEIETALGLLAFGFCRPTGKPTPADIQDAYRSRAGQKVLHDKVSLLHCTTEYPAPFEDVNLRAMRTLREAFGLPVGLSDHTPGISVPIAAVACGATIIEKHFTLDKAMPGPDHKASLDPAELRALVRSIREVETAMGSSLKVPSPSELKNRAIARKSLVAAVAIRRGEVLTQRNLATKRPGTGVSAIRYFDYLGRTAQRSYKADELI